jgi:hypothetical protein
MPKPTDTVPLPTFMSLVPVFVALAISACASKRDAACSDLLKAQLKTDSTAEVSAKRQTFFSTKLETCILVEEDLTRVGFVIDDMTDDFIRTSVLFNCDRDGVDAAILDSVRAHQGYVWELPYAQYLDDGAGGPPRAIKTPAKPYSTAMCRAALDKFLVQVR